MPKILICDDHNLFAHGLKQLLSKEFATEDITIVHTFEMCKKSVESTFFDVFICDLNIDKKDGLVLVEALNSYLSNTKVIILTSYHEKYLIEKAQKLGIKAFLKKDTSIEIIYSLIREVSPVFFVEEFFPEKTTTSNKLALLTRQEKEIIKLIVKGKSSHEIGEQLFISKNTVDTHRKNINRKLEIDNIAYLIKIANENFIID